MNDRIKQLRTVLNLSGEKFGSIIGLGKMAISHIENNDSKVTEQTIKLICREFNVNEEWLRTGQGDMFVEYKTADLDTIAEQQHVDPLEMDIIKAYFALDKTTRTTIINHFKDQFSKE